MARHLCEIQFPAMVLTDEFHGTLDCDMRERGLLNGK